MAKRVREIYEDTADVAKEKVADATGAVKDRAIEASGVAKGKAVEATEAIKDKAVDVLGTVVEKTRDLSEEARSVATDQLSRGSRQVGSRVKATGASVHSVEDALRQHGQEHAADIASHAADGLESVGSRLQDVGHRSRWSRFRAFLTKPWLLMSGALLMAIVVYRFLKTLGDGTRH
jgi:hypothetical protein